MKNKENDIMDDKGKASEETKFPITREMFYAKVRSEQTTALAR